MQRAGRTVLILAVEVCVLVLASAAVIFALVQLAGPGRDAPGSAPGATLDAVTGREGAASVASTPTVVDNHGRPLTPEHAAVVRDVHHALTTGDLGQLRRLYAGDDWAAQEPLLAQRSVRTAVLRVLQTHPANLGEGYVYPGFASFGWSSRFDVADGRLLGVAPDQLPHPKTGYAGVETAFFLDAGSGVLQWRGVRQRTGGTAT